MSKSKIIVASFLFAIVSGGISSQGIASVSSARISASVISKPGPQLNAKEAQALSLAAGEIVRQSNFAVRALENQNLSEAKSDVAKALTLVKIVEQAAPRTIIETKISSGKLVFKDNKSVPDSIIPIYDELEGVSVLEPVIAAKKRSLAKSSGAPGTMGVGLDEEMVQTSVSLDVALAKFQLLKAKAALLAKNEKAASRALERLDTDVIFSYAQEDRPLLTVRDNLILAKKAILASRYAEAQAALDAAKTALEEYSKSSKNSHAEEADILRSKISDLEDSVKSQEEKKPGSPADISPKVSSAPAHLDHWWNKVRGWF